MTTGFLQKCQDTLLTVLNLTPQKETSCHIFKAAIFSKLFGDFMRHTIR